MEFVFYLSIDLLKWKIVLTLYTSQYAILEFLLFNTLMYTPIWIRTSFKTIIFLSLQSFFDMPI